jgi:hypothetical protein
MILIIFRGPSSKRPFLFSNEIGKIQQSVLGLTLHVHTLPHN